MNTIIFASAVFALAFGQEVNLNENSLAPTLMDKAASVGLAQPTSPAIYIETSQEGNFLEATSTLPEHSVETTSTSDLEAEEAPGHAGGVFNVMGAASEGDIHGANPRQNLVYFGVGRHGFGIGAECDGCLGCGGSGCSSCKGGNTQTQRNSQQPCAAEPEHYNDPCEPNRNAQPYLKVTPTVNVQALTRTHVETHTSPIYDVQTSFKTRTVTDQFKSTRTEWVHPEQTFTYVEYQTVYEYPAATIDASNVRHPVDPNYNRNANGNSNSNSNNNNNDGGCCFHGCH